MLGRWVICPSNQASEVPSIIFFIISYRLRALKTLYFYFCKFIKKNWNDFCKEFCRKLWQINNTWNIRHLFDESFIPATQRTSEPVYYIENCRISDFHRWTKYGSVAVNCEKKDGYLYALAFVSELASCFCLCTLKGKHWNATANGTGCNFPINSLLDEVIN